MNKILVIAEFDQQGLKKSTLCTLTAAQQLGNDIDLLIAGTNADAIAEQAKTLQGINQLLLCNSNTYDHGLAENITDLVLTIAKNYHYILAPATSFGKNILPRVAAKLDVAMVSDITQIIDHETFVRPVYAGNALATVKCQEPIKVITVRPTAFEAAQYTNHQANIITLEPTHANDKTAFIKNDFAISERPMLDAATVIIAGGRAFQSSENFVKYLEPLAQKLNAAIGASRAAVDAGFAPNDYQVGQTGKVVAPELYIAIGISGAVQHLAGMKESKVIVAINKDPEAPIFQIADYALVGDLFEIIPELIEKL